MRKKNKKDVKFRIKLKRKIKRLARKIAELSAYQDDWEEWWGLDTELGDLPSKIQKEVEEFADWLIEEVENEKRKN